MNDYTNINSSYAVEGRGSIDFLPIGILLLIFSIIVTTVVVISVIRIVIKESKVVEKTPKKAATQDSSKGFKAVLTPISQMEELELDRFCKYCGTILSYAKKECSSCGAKITKDFLSKKE